MHNPGSLEGEPDGNDPPHTPPPTPPRELPLSMSPHGREWLMNQDHNPSHAVSNFAASLAGDLYPEGLHELPQPNAVPVASVAVPLPPEDLTYIWCTGIALETFRAEFRRFLEECRPHAAEDSSVAAPLIPSPTPYFIQLMQEMRITESYTLTVDMSLLRQEAPNIFHQTCSHPSECLQIMGAVASEVFISLFPDVPKDTTINIAAKNLPSSTPLRDLTPQHIETLVAIQGMVVRTSKLIPEVRVAFFSCWVCNHAERCMVDRGRIYEPVRCRHCGKQYSYQLIHNNSLFEDKQIVRIQEAPEDLSEGETPVTISVVVYGPLVDVAVPGDRVVVTGIFRSAPIRLNANTKIIRSVFRTHIDAVHIDKTVRASRFGQSGLVVSPLDPADTRAVDRLFRIARHPDVYRILLNSFAATIWGHDDVKRGILCQMFGGTPKTFRHGSFRSEIHIILCGDPGVAKSQLLTQVHALCERGVYTSGKGSSSVGLTAFVIKDADTGEFVLEPGALVLSDRGICCIDEFDKMDDSTRSVLHEVMEQQTLSIAKAGIIAQLNAHSSILAAANPKESQWNPSLNIVENLQVEPTLLSRFDLIFLLLDRHDGVEDRQLAAHVLDLFIQKRKADDATTTTADADNLDSTAVPVVLPPKLFSQYVAYARQNISPKLSEEAHRALVTSYVEMRQMRGTGKTVSATLRQLESMIRLSEARAKMRFSSEVTREDVVESKRLISSALKEAATDPRTGLISLELFAAPDLGKTSVESTMIRLQHLIETKLIPAGRKTIPMGELRMLLSELMPGQKPLAPSQLHEMLSIMAGGEHIHSFTASTVTLAGQQ